ncbi:hypothetical protein D6Z83_15000 [Pseudoroseomonas wenyumeiae]|uniref:Glucose-methanol-choline oxidoreductase N-terminal domain-containing protein n=1 Tax=Teichococcus wenyumeiae TaxID=2478470 RepID=A0A3A9J7X1_9PROT|nr:hypothetical protein D6Z83_15000 [Pseudoroseomonas wenyumeiae]
MVGLCPADGAGAGRAWLPGAGRPERGLGGWRNSHRHQYGGRWHARRSGRRLSDARGPPPAEPAHPQAEVLRLEVESTRVTGCLLRLGGEEVTVRARETILAAGAIWSPVLLMRSGIGPAAALRAGAGGACRSAWRG